MGVDKQIKDSTFYIILLGISVGVLLFRITSSQLESLQNQTAQHCFCQQSQDPDSILANVSKDPAQFQGGKGKAATALR